MKRHNDPILHGLFIQKLYNNHYTLSWPSNFGAMNSIEYPIFKTYKQAYDYAIKEYPQFRRYLYLNDCVPDGAQPHKTKPRVYCFKRYFQKV